MKKTVAILLAVLMVISSISCIFTVSVAAATNSVGEYFENPDNCALYNIGVCKDGTTDYSKYDATYYVRSYIVFKNANGDTKVYYGDTQSASVFAVMQTILKSTATYDQTTSDKAYVKNFLDGNVEGFTADAAAIKEAWLSNSSRATVYTPAN